MTIGASWDGFLIHVLAVHGRWGIAGSTRKMVRVQNFFQIVDFGGTNFFLETLRVLRTLRVHKKAFGYKPYRCDHKIYIGATKVIKSKVILCLGRNTAILRKHIFGMVSLPKVCSYLSPFPLDP